MLEFGKNLVSINYEEHFHSNIHTIHFPGTYINMKLVTNRLYHICGGQGYFIT